MTRPQLRSARSDSVQARIDEKGSGTLPTTTFRSPDVVSNLPSKGSLIENVLPCHAVRRRVPELIKTSFQEDVRGTIADTTRRGLPRSVPEPVKSARQSASPR